MGEPHPLTRVGFASLIQGEANLMIGGQAHGQGDVVHKAQSQSSGLVVTALSLATGHGFDPIRSLRAIPSHVCVLVCSSYDERLYASRDIKTGAGHVGSWEDACRLMMAIRCVHAERTGSSRAASEGLRKAISLSDEVVLQSSLAFLSNHKLMVFEPTGQGMELRQVADRFHVCVKIVETYRHNLRRKWRLGAAAKLVRAALTWTLDECGYDLAASHRAGVANSSASVRRCH